IGLRYAGHIDPFDGGPHFMAKTDEILLIRTLTRAEVVALPESDESQPWGIIAVERERTPRFAACGARFRLEGRQVGLPPAPRELLGLLPGESVWVQPVP